MRRMEGHDTLLSLVIGAWQEGSRDLHMLDPLADAKVSTLA